MNKQKTRRPELLAPAGNMEKFFTALHFGADAVYLAGEEFGMRTAAANFGEEDLKKGIEYAHRHGVKVHIACNVIPHNEEIARLPDFLKTVNALGADALIAADIGTIGLIKAVSTFNADKGIHLATYASRCIENEILMFFRNQKKTAQDVFISDPIDTDKDGNTLTLIDVIADKSDIADEIDTKIKVEKLRVILPVCLTERERLIIEMRYGLCGREELTQREIAKKLNISRSYVSRIEKSALEKLRKQF